MAAQEHPGTPRFPVVENADIGIEPGHRFGRLTYLGQSYRDNESRVFVNCQCDCGNIKWFRLRNLQTGNTKSCGCYRSEFRVADLAGKTFGLWTVIGPSRHTEENTCLEWLCRCACGTERYVVSSSLITGNSTGCGCVRPRRIVDLTGKTFGMWTVIGPYQRDSKSNRVKWLCKCACGAERYVLANNLLAGNTTGCGCVSKRGAKIEDLTGRQFGMLTVVGPSRRTDGRTEWLCRCACDAHTEKYVLAASLKNGHTKSCGCRGKSNLMK